MSASSAVKKCSMLTSSRHTGSGQVNHRGKCGVGQDRLRLARIALDRDHPVTGGQQRLRMRHGYWVVVDVRHPRTGDDRPRALVQTRGCRQARADIQVLRDALARHMPGGSGQERAVRPGDDRRVGQCRDQPLRGLPVRSEMVLPAEQVVVDTRDVRPGRIEPLCPGDTVSLIRMISHGRRSTSAYPSPSHPHQATASLAAASMLPDATAPPAHSRRRCPAMASTSRIVHNRHTRKS
jgi:hypothetical protein